MATAEASAPSLIARPADAMAISDGSIEALKWLGLFAMVVDHVGKYLLNESAITFAIGRIALPLFGFVLAYNLARPGVLARGTHKRLMGRLLITAAIATPPFLALGGLGWGWWPFNIMTTLLAATLIIFVLDVKARFHKASAVLLFVVTGAFVEFWWPALAMIVAAWRYCRHPTTSTLILWLLMIGALAIINRNAWALAAVLPIFAVSRIQIDVPRIGKWFYVFYPVQLAAIWLARTISV